MILHGTMKKIESNLYQAVIPQLAIGEFGESAHSAKIMLKAKILSFAPNFDFNLIYDGETFWLETKDFIMASKLILSRNGAV
jgi:hypothetical protein